MSRKKIFLYRAQNYKWLLFTWFFAVACAPSKGPHQPIPQTRPSQALENQQDFQSVLPIVQQRCARCHNAGTNDWTKEENLKRISLSGALGQRLANKTMPQVGSPEAGAITAEETAKLIAFAQGAAKAGVTAAVASVDGPEVVRDQFLSVLNRCSTCHGLQGHSAIDDTTPHLAGHNKVYITARLQQFLRPESKDSVMQVAALQPLASAFGWKYTINPDGTVMMDQAMTEVLDKVAEYFSQQKVLPAPEQIPAVAEADQAAYARGKKIVVANNCMACHLPQYSKPMQGAAMIFGQKPKYLEKRLAEFLSGHGGLVMPSVLQSVQVDGKGATEQDFNAIVKYLSLTHPEAVVP